MDAVADHFGLNRVGGLDMSLRPTADPEFMFVFYLTKELNVLAIWANGESCLTMVKIPGYYRRKLEMSAKNHHLWALDILRKFMLKEVKRRPEAVVHINLEAPDSLETMDNWLKFWQAS